jgi:hypothetical protein
MALLISKDRLAYLGTGLGFIAGLCAWIQGCSAARVGEEQEHPTLTFPTHFEHDADAGATSSKPTPAPERKNRLSAGFASDPPPLYSREHWELELKYDHGRISVASVKARHLDSPEATPRRTGRFAFELWLGHELIERTRFDFPLLAAERPPASSKRELHPDPLFGPGAEVTRTITLPADSRATRAQIVDRATAEILEVSWPPQATPAPSPPASK